MTTNKGLGIHEFLSHSSRGGGGKILDWKQEGRVKVFLHPRAPIHPVWRHNWYKVVEVEDKDTKEKVKKVFQFRFGCHETEAICRKSRFRDRETSVREYPPAICPLDMMVEAVVHLVVTGKIAWTDPVFEFRGDDPEYDVTLTAAGLYGGYNRKSFSKEQIAQMRKAGVRRDEAWKEDARVKLAYVFQVVDADDPSDGIVTAIEPALLGDKVKAEIGKVMKRKGRESGDPTLHPYPLEWTIDEDQEDFGKKYDATALEEPPSAGVLDLFKQEPESIDKYIEPGDCLALLESMRAHCVLDEGLLDFERIFKPARDAGLMKPRPKPEDEHSDSDDDDAEEDDEATTTSKEELYDCDVCGAATMRDTDLACPACGAEYDEAGLAKRKCAACGTLCTIARDEDRTICPACATIHSSREWEVIKKGGQAPAEKPAPRKRSAAATTTTTTEMQPEGKPAAKKKSGDTVPFSR
jgi:RNA polymerase subunit RPABC4/transcription elongation factor Spt4